ncbi:MAG: hypothetical protein CVU71_13300 [Deltaproteobacteria bacterium HGW-Deltaproteobacteria-6]|nr:MAG: hypothetical protein CVU71_13300 [Deltaproteobacteria bacterium HGW-Deltaproteobacteria-6]
MKKTLVCMAGVICLLAAFALAADKPATVSNQGAVLKTTNVKTAKMNARGKVVEISDKAIKIERGIKGNLEIMELALENPVQDIAVNDSVKIVYSVKDGKLTASRVAKLGAKNPGKNGIKQSKEKPASAAK